MSSPRSPHERPFIRDLQDTDVDAVAAVLADAFIGGGHLADTARARLTAVEAHAAACDVRVAVDGRGSVTGVVMRAPSDSTYASIALPGEVELRMLAVDPRHQGQGIGRELVLDAVAAARRDRRAAVVLWTRPSMTVAAGLYEKLGFQRWVDGDSVDADSPRLAYRLHL